MALSVCLSVPLCTVPAQPSSFEAEAELDTRIMLTWLWPVQDSITKYELQYWEADSANKVGRVSLGVILSLCLSLSLARLCLSHKHRGSFTTECEVADR